MKSFIAPGVVLLLALAGLGRPAPANSPKGKTLFANNCAACHGPTGQGGEGPSLRGIKLSDGLITSTINNGVKGEMPAFKSKLKSPDVKAIVAYLRTLKK